MRGKHVRQDNKFQRGGKITPFAELGEQFQEIENKGYDNASLKKKGKTWRQFTSNDMDLKALRGCWKIMKLYRLKKSLKNTQARPEKQA